VVVHIYMGVYMYIYMHMHICIYLCIGPAAAVVVGGGGGGGGGGWGGKSYVLLGGLVGVKLSSSCVPLGSTNVGKLLMRQCAGTVKRLSLELGGNTPSG